MRINPVHRSAEERLIYVQNYLAIASQISKVFRINERALFPPAGKQKLRHLTIPRLRSPEKEGVLGLEVQSRSLFQSEAIKSRGVSHHSFSKFISSLAFKKNPSEIELYKRYRQDYLRQVECKQPRRVPGVLRPSQLARTLPGFRGE
jgi:hypothetical protein